MTRPTYISLEESQDKQKIALQRAKEHLLQQGITYPLYDSNKSPEENYGALCAYSQLEAELVVKFLKEEITPRPLIMDTVKPKKDWGGSYYDN